MSKATKKDNHTFSRILRGDIYIFMPWKNKNI